MIGTGSRALLLAGVVLAVAPTGVAQGMSCLERLHLVDEALDRDALPPDRQLQIEVAIARGLVAGSRGDLVACRAVTAELAQLIALRQSWDGEIHPGRLDLMRLREILTGWAEIQPAAAQQQSGDAGAAGAAGNPTSPPGLEHAIETAEQALLEQNLAAAQAALAIARQIELGARDSGEEIDAALERRIAALQEEIEPLLPAEETAAAPEEPETDIAAVEPDRAPDAALAEEIDQAMAALREALADRAQRLGEELAAPAAGPAEAGPCGASVRLASGDTLYSIARRCETSVDAILRANPQIEDPQQLQVGQVIELPADIAAAPAPDARAEAPPAESPEDGARDSYTMQPGDTLFSIAGRFGTDVDQLLALNPGIEDPAQIRAGREIRVPRPAD